MESLLAAAGNLDSLLDELEQENPISASSKILGASSHKTKINNDRLNLSTAIPKVKTTEQVSTNHEPIETTPSIENPNNNIGTQNLIPWKENEILTKPNPFADDPYKTNKNLLDFDDEPLEPSSKQSDDNTNHTISNVDLLMQLTVTDFDNFSKENQFINKTLESPTNHILKIKCSSTEPNGISVLSDNSGTHNNESSTKNENTPSSAPKVATGSETGFKTDTTFDSTIKQRNTNTDNRTTSNIVTPASNNLKDVTGTTNYEAPIGFSNDVDLSDAELNEFLQSQEIMDQIMSSRQDSDSSSTCSSDSSSSGMAKIEEDFEDSNLEQINTESSLNTPVEITQPPEYMNDAAAQSPTATMNPINQSNVDDIQVLPFDTPVHEPSVNSTIQPPHQKPAVKALVLGDFKPTWVPDSEAPNCNLCQLKFTFTRRRHHCRACGKVFCSNCCYHKTVLKYLDSNHEERVCSMCYSIILQKSSEFQANSPANQTSATVPNIQPESGTSSLLNQQVTQNPATGVSVRPKNQTSSSPQVSMPKSVRFADGTRPDHPVETPLTPPMPPRGPRSKKIKSHTDNIIPPVVLGKKRDRPYQVEENPDMNFISSVLASEGPDPVEFLINPNLILKVRFLMCGSRHCWCFWSSGMSSVGQNEIALLFEREGLGDVKIPKDVFVIFRSLYERARRGKVINNYDLLAGNALGFSKDQTWCGSKLNAGILFVEPTYQFFCGFYPGDTNRDSTLEHKKYFSVLFGLLVHRLECPWAALVPKRLLLRLGAATHQYPCPLFSVRQRSSVFSDIGHTILGILCDFTNYKYKVLTVPGIKVIVDTSGKVLLQIPCNRFTDIIKIINSSSNESVFAVASGALSPPREKKIEVDEDTVESDSHLVCMQDQKSLAYHTELLVMKNVNPKNTGAVFIVFNGSLHSEEHNSIKANIIEDGIMVQLMPEKMSELISTLKAMEDFKVDNPSSDPGVVVKSLEIRWINDDRNFNIGLFSPIDYTSFEGILGFNVQGRSEQKGQNYIMRWNQVFFIDNSSDTLDASRLAEQIANSVFIALTPLLQDLVNNNQMNLSIRVTIHPESVSYLAGSCGSSLPSSCMNSLDNELVSTIHNAASNLQSDAEPIVLELLFSVLNIRFNYVTANDM